MKSFIAISLAVVLLLCGCSAIPSTSSSDQMSEMLQEAMLLSNDGNYEEAILVYENILEIEPNNYYATLGIGHVFRISGNTTDAVAFLKRASEMEDDVDKQALYELGYAYLDEGKYKEARSLVVTETSNADIDPAAATILVLCYTADNDFTNALRLFQLHSVISYFYSLPMSEIIYFGPYNASGQMHGKGIGIYYRGQYIYYGDYVDGQRSGSGIWLRVLDGSSSLSKVGFYDGAWANDAPNGYGEFHIDYSEQGIYAMRSGNYTDGLENGEMAVSYGEHFAPYVSTMGIRKCSGDAVEMPSGRTAYYYAYCSKCEGGCEGSWVIFEHQLDGKWGVTPWGATTVRIDGSTNSFAID